MSQITLNMNDEDFEGLWENAMRWGTSWHKHDGRFENATKGKKYSDPYSYEWAMAYWFGDNRAEKVLGCAYLDSIGQAYEVLWDTAIDAGYVVITNYVSSSWKESA